MIGDTANKTAPPRSSILRGYDSSRSVSDAVEGAVASIVVDVAQRSVAKASAYPDAHESPEARWALRNIKSNLVQRFVASWLAFASSVLIAAAGTGRTVTDLIDPSSHTSVPALGVHAGLGVFGLISANFVARRKSKRRPS
jgi:hypothetical protein